MSHLAYLHRFSSSLPHVDKLPSVSIMTRMNEVMALLKNSYAEETRLLSEAETLHQSCLSLTRDLHKYLGDNIDEPKHLDLKYQNNMIQSFLNELADFINVASFHIAEDDTETLQQLHSDFHLIFSNRMFTSIWLAFEYPEAERAGHAY